MAYGKFNNIVSHSVLDSKHITRVSVNVTFNVLGEMRPDYVQVVQADESRETFKIHSSKLTKQLSAYMQYTCTIVSAGRIKEIKLTFFTADHVWCIEK